MTTCASLVDECIRKIQDRATSQNIGAIDDTCAAIIFDFVETGQKEVVALSTGAESKQWTQDPRLIHNFHAEVLVRRAFIAFLQRQLESYAEANQWSFGKFASSLFSSGAENTSRYFEKSDRNLIRLRKDIKVIFYCTKPPCGDVAETLDSNEGKLRVTHKDGNGTLFLDTVDLNKALNISCSDRLLSWNIVGLQGRRLSKYLEPIYIDIMSVPSGCKSAVQRAVHSRYKGPLKIKEPTIVEEIKYQTGKPKNYSINWILEFKPFEKVDIRTGMAVIHQGSSKKAVYFTSRLSASMANNRDGVLSSSGLLKNHDNQETYDENKARLRYDLKESGCGDWNRFRNHAKAPKSVWGYLGDLIIIPAKCAFWLFSRIFLDNRNESGQPKYSPLV